MLGYHPPNQIIVLECIIYTDKHISEFYEEMPEALPMSISEFYEEMPEALPMYISDSEGVKRILRNNETICGYCFGDSAFETHILIELCLEKNITPIFKPTKTPVRIKTSAKAMKKIWNGNYSRLYREIRGTAEVLYGAITIYSLIHSNSRLVENQYKDPLLVALRQNLFTLLSLLSFIAIVRKTQKKRKAYKDFSFYTI